MIETRAKKIFDYLSLVNKYYTAKEIASHLKLSEKTIRNEINLLNFHLINNGAEIKSKTGKGYKFTILNQETFEKFLKKDWYKIAFYSQDLNDRAYRLENILATFLFSDDYIKQQELAEAYSVSVSQINKDIKKVKKTLERYDLMIISRPYHGMKIEGSEKSIRACIKNELQDVGEIFDLERNKKLYKDIEEIINSFDVMTDYNIPYASFKNLSIHIYIAILRIKNNRIIELSDEKRQSIVQHEYYHLAEKIVQKLSENLEIEFPKDELIYIAMHLISKNRVADFEKVSTEITDLVNDILEKIFQTTNYDLRDNFDLFFSLCTHLGPLIERIKFGLVMKNPLLEDIKKYPIPYQLATIAAYVINSRYQTKLSEDEIAYIALHLSNGINVEQKHNLNLLIVCGSGLSSSQMIKIQLEKRFYRQIQEIEIADLMKLDTYHFEDYDFIISTIDLDIKTATPIIQVGVIFKSDDIKNLEQTFIKEEVETIQRIFNNSFIHYNLDLKKVEDVFTVISRDVEDKTGFSQERVYEMLVEREDLGSTAYENKIVVPHILESLSEETFLVIITLKEAIEWTDKKVSLVFALFISKKVENMNLFYNKLGYFMNSPEAINKAIKSKNKLEFMEHFIGGTND